MIIMSNYIYLNCLYSGIKCTFNYNNDAIILNNLINSLSYQSN